MKSSNPSQENPNKIRANTIRHTDSRPGAGMAAPENIRNAALPWL
jgi:hypothetical protein